MQLKCILLTCLISTASAADVTDYNNLSDYYGFGPMEVIKLDWGVGGMSCVDLNNDGRNDIIVVNNRRARIEILLQKEQIEPAEQDVTVDPEDFEINAINPPSRFAHRPLPVSERLYSLVTGDLNADGMVDLAYYGEPKGLYVVLQKEQDEKSDDKSQLSWRMRKKINIEDGLLSPYALLCADLNNDGLDDLAIAARDAIYLVAQKPDGTLAEPVKYPSTSTLKAIDAADLDGDSIEDLLMLTDTLEKPISIRFVSPAGQLGPQQQFNCETPWALETFDIDKSGTDELLIVDSVSGRLLCYELTDDNDVQGDWPILFYPLPSGEGADKRDLAAADFDGDSLTDIVISDPGAAEIIFYKQHAYSGLSEPKRFPALADVSNITAADINGDGKSELAVLSIKEKIIGISEFENDRLSFPKPLDVVGEPVAMALADVDEDSNIDCVYVSRDANDSRWLRVLYDVTSYGDIDGKTPGAKELELLENRNEASAILLEKLLSNPDGIKLLDADNDGLLDVLIFDQYNPPPIFVRQVHKGQFEIVDSPGAQSSLIRDATPASVALADIDKTAGDELLIAQNNFARSLVFENSLNWRVLDQYNAKSTENRISAVAAFYLSGLGLTDKPAIVLLDTGKGQLQILTPDEDGTYRFKKELEIGKWNSAPHLKMLYESVGGTPAKSIVLFDSEKFAVMTPPSEEHRIRRLEQRFSYETKIRDGVYGLFTVGDINSDERTDIVMLEYKGNHIEILALNAEYQPVPAMRFKIFEEKSYREAEKRSAGVEPRELKISDVTGDGKGDLVTLIHDRIIIYPQD
ncbi:MAG: VCBS repeat-containing protein [Phycisphaerae bacterium]